LQELAVMGKELNNFVINDAYYNIFSFWFLRVLVKFFVSVLKAAYKQTMAGIPVVCHIFKKMVHRI
jgi:hypothetical protein